MSFKELCCRQCFLWNSFCTIFVKPLIKTDFAKLHQFLVTLYPCEYHCHLILYHLFIALAVFLDRKQHPALAIIIAVFFFWNTEAKRRTIRRMFGPSNHCWIVTIYHMYLLEKLENNNPNDFKNYPRMLDDCFQHLLHFVEHLISKIKTIITEEERRQQLWSFF